MTSVAAPPNASARRSGPMASPGAVVLQQRLAEAAEEVRRGDALLRVLDADAEDLLGLLDLAEVHARAARAGPGPWR